LKYRDRQREGSKYIQFNKNQEGGEVVEGGRGGYSEETSPVEAREAGGLETIRFGQGK
jgi:hypothetical protein